MCAGCQERSGAGRSSGAERSPCGLDSLINEAGDHGGGSPLQEAKTGQPPEEER